LYKIFSGIMDLTCIDYGAGNLRSIVNGFRRVGVKVELAGKPGVLEDASGIILPGVGSFGDAMRKLKAFKPVLVDAVSGGTPFLGVCLGIQVVFESSGESPGVDGLGLLEGSCKKFTGSLKVPHMGWNSVKIVGETPLLEGVLDESFFYFVHSYRVVPNSRDVIAGETEYGTTFPSIVSTKNIHATQFHPEKSGENGLQILKNFAEMCRK
jgi:glutamine amidotransferase